MPSECIDKRERKSQFCDFLDRRRDIPKEKVCSLPALKERLCEIASCDPVGQSAAVTLALIGYATSDLPAVLGYLPEPFEFALSVEVFGPALALLLLLTLLILDLRNRFRSEVAEHASRYDVFASNTLRLSSENLQSAYTAWMGRFQLVRSYPAAVLVLQSVVHVILALKPAEARCRWFPNAIGLPSTFLLAVRVVLENRRADASIKSQISFMSTAWIAVAWSVLMAGKDECYLSMGGVPTGWQTAKVEAFVAAVHAAIGFIMSPVEMDYVPALAVLIFITRGPAVYFQFLHLNDGFTWSSDPNLWVFLAVVMATAVTCLAAVGVRYYLAKRSMLLFFLSLQRYES